ncbi:MAG: hypothetical protein JWO36_3591 [Myxococcales bacterium]|nr:hypothetical protein [Myxococcales bacterium]
MGRRALTTGGVTVLALILCAGCNRHINPEWCAQPGHSDPLCTELDGGAAHCTKDEDCSNGLVCDTAISGGACVACTDTNVAMCSPPICLMDKCAACATNADCPSEACLPDGACAAEANVLYASPMGSGAACTRAQKCSFAMATGLVTAARKTIMLDAGTYLGAQTLARSAQVVGRGAIVDANGQGAGISVTNDAAVELDFMTIQNATTASGLTCDSGNIVAHAITVTANQFGIIAACTLQLDRSQVTHNANGALEVTAGTINVRNNFFVNNGNINLSNNRNVTIGSAVTGAFVFNTVAYNVSKFPSLPGIACSATTLDAEGNLITDNNRAGNFNSTQVSGSCDFTKSYTQSGMNDLHWVDVTSDFHLTVLSTPVIDVGLANCAGLTDFDGDARPMGGGCDLGADELKP